MLIKDRDTTSQKLLLIKQDRVLIKVLASLTSESEIFLNFFSTFQKKWVGRAMGNETFYWNGLNDTKMG